MTYYQFIKHDFKKNPLKNLNQPFKKSDEEFNREIKSTAKGIPTKLLEYTTSNDYNLF